jgi:hypothetical protein
MRAYEFITEAAPFKTDLQAELQKDWMPQKYVPDPQTRGKGLTLPRNEKGWPVEPGLAPSPVGPEDLVGLGIPSLAKGVAKGAAAAVPKRSTAEIVSDFKNVPSIAKPWTYNKMGHVFADDMAHQAYIKQHGKPFNPEAWHADEARAFYKLEKNFSNRGYPTKPQLPDIDLKPPGYHQFYNKNPHKVGTPEFEKWNTSADQYKSYHKKPTEPNPKDQFIDAVKDSASRTATYTGLDLVRQNTSKEQQSTNSKK